MMKLERRKLFSYGVVMLSLFFLGIMSGSVSAQASSSVNGVVQPIQEGISTGYELFRPLLEGIIGDASTSDTFLAKVLFLIIIFSVMWLALSKVPLFSETSWVLWVVSISASILSVRWFGDSEIVASVILPYSALGVTVTAGLPFLLWFFIVKDFHRTARKVAWILFAVVFVGLWIVRYDAGGVTETGKFTWIYLVTALLSLGMLRFDVTFQRWRHKAAAERRDAVGIRKQIEIVDKEMDERMELYTKNGVEYTSRYSRKSGSKGYDHDMDELGKKRDKLMKRLSKS